MKFSQSGLPNDKVVEEAFNYSYAKTMALRHETLKQFKLQIDRIHAQQLHALDAHRAASAQTNVPMTDAVYNSEKNALAQEHADQLAGGPRAVEAYLNNTFAKQHLTPALELHRHSDKTSPALLAAAVLSDAVRSPIDYEEVITVFGKGIGGLVAECCHLVVYPGEADTLLKNAGSDAKRIYLANVCADLGFFHKMAKANPMQKIAFPPEHAEALFKNAKLLWGNDKKLDQRFVAVFNLTAAAVASVCRMEVAADGALQMIKGTVAPPNNPGFRPTRPGGPAGGGDSVF